MLNIESSGKKDILKLSLALFVLLLALFGFYYYAEQPLFYRVSGFLLAVAASVFIALQTEKGRYIWSFLDDAQTEVRKVVWPSRQETIQTTLLVIFMVVVFALILWGLDVLLGWLIGTLIGGG